MTQRCLLLAACALAAAGCAGLSGGGLGSVPEVSAKAARQLGPSLAYVKIASSRSGSSVLSQLAPGISISGAGSRPPEYAGIVLTTNGYVLVPALLKPDLEDRIDVWLGDELFTARPIKSDESLGMSIIKVDADRPLTPMRLDRAADLRPGEWGFALFPTDEDNDFQVFTSTVSCEGERGGRYRRFALAGLSRDAKGAPVLNLRGELVGLAGSGDAIALADIRNDLADFVAAATGARSAEDEEKRKGWIGVYVDPINKNLARMRELPESGLWVQHVDKDAPAWEAGVRVGDLVTSVNGQRLRFSGRRAHEFFMKSLHAVEGAPFAIGILRDGSERELRGTVTRRPEPVTLRAEDLGVTVQSLREAEVFAMNLATGEGVLVTDVSRGSAAATGSNMRQMLLMKGDVLVELDNRPTPTVEAFSRAVESVRREHKPTVLVKYFRGKTTGFAGLNLKIGEKDNGGRE